MVNTAVGHPQIDTGLCCRFPGPPSAYNVLVDAVDVDLLMKCAVSGILTHSVPVHLITCLGEEVLLPPICMMHRDSCYVLCAALASGHTQRSQHLIQHFKWCTKSLLLFSLTLECIYPFLSSWARERRFSSQHNLKGNVIFPCFRASMTVVETLIVPILLAGDVFRCSQVHFPFCSPRHAMCILLV